MTEENNFYRDLIDNLADGIYFIDRERKITYWNKGAEHITGYPGAKVVGHYCYDNLLNHVNIDGELLCKNKCPLVTCMENDSIVSADVYLRHADGHRVPIKVRASPMRDPDGKIIGAVETFSNESEGLSIRKELLELRHTAQTDALTGVGNRHFIEGRLHAVVSEQEFRKKLDVGVLFFDIDNFKLVNDSYGHDIGDKVLKMTAATVSENLRKSDIIGRWGGEEFLVILYDISSLKSLTFIAEKIRLLVECSRLEIANSGVQVSISIGATLLQPLDTPESILRRVDSLMYESKHTGRNRVSVG